jgi:hypothetical protein
VRALSGHAGAAGDRVRDCWGRSPRAQKRGRRGVVLKAQEIAVLFFPARSSCRGLLTSDACGLDRLCGWIRRALGFRVASLLGRREWCPIAAASWLPVRPQGAGVARSGTWIVVIGCGFAERLRRTHRCCRAGRERTSQAMEVAGCAASDLLVDPGARSRHCAEVRDVIVCHAVRGWLRQTTRDPSNTECHECEEATSPGDALWHV